MVIYGNNLHEKLQGLAISREFLKYNTPFCDIVDAPEWQLDINLALDYNCAINGSADCATKLVQDLTLNSSVLDNSTVEFYLHKITYNPIFSSAIKEMRTRWSNLDAIDDDFQKKLLDALKDCLNSPCNLFAETSDSIGRMAQSASTNTSDNTMGSLVLREGSTAGQGDDVDDNPTTSISNMIDGLDQTITNKIPSIFKKAFTEVVSVADKAFTNTQDVLAGKKNLSELTTRVQEGKSFRSPAKVFRYSPDVKSYYDYSAASSNVLAKIKEDIGGCFNRFEFKYRYNPYENNMSRPIGTTVQQVNGKKYDASPTGQADRSGQSNSHKLDKQTTTSSAGDNLQSNVIAFGDSKSTDKVKISKSFLLDQKVTVNDVTNKQNYSVFSSLIDVDTRTLWYEGYDATPDDVLTLQGVGNVGQNYRIGTSILGPNKDFTKRALENEEVTINEIKKYGTTTQPGNYAAGYKHQLDDEGMETLFNTPDEMIINDGVAISRDLFKEFVNDPSLEGVNTSYKDPQLKNEFFIAARPAKATEGRSNGFKFYKVCDYNSQKRLNVDFTMGAYKHFLKSFGYGDLTAASSGISRRRPVDGTSWTRVNKVFTEKIGGPMEVRVCQGNIDDLKVAFAAENNEVPLEDDPFSQANIDAGSLDGTSGNIVGSNVVYELGGKIRNQPIQPKLAKILEQASADSGYKLVVFSGGQDTKGQGTRRTGSTRHDRGYAADIRVYDNGTRLSSEVTAHHVRLAIFAKILKRAGMESFGSGPGYMGGNHHVDIAISAGQGVATTWGAGGKSANTPGWLKRSFR
jgi:hypothetical protein